MAVSKTHSVLSPDVWSVEGPVPGVAVVPCWTSHVYGNALLTRLGLSTYHPHMLPPVKSQVAFAQLDSSEPSLQLGLKSHT